MPKADFLQILKVLGDHKVEFIVVGGVCGVLHGAPIATFDLDIVHSRKPDNIEKLLSALGILEARFRAQHGRNIKPDESHLSGPGHQLLVTVHGPLDVLGMVGKGSRYENLLNHTEEIVVKSGLRIRVLTLPKLIEIKEETATTKDQIAIEILRQTQKESGR